MGLSPKMNHIKKLQHMFFSQRRRLTGFSSNTKKGNNEMFSAHQPQVTKVDKPTLANQLPGEKPQKPQVEKSSSNNILVCSVPNITSISQSIDNEMRIIVTDKKSLVSNTNTVNREPEDYKKPWSSGLQDMGKSAIKNKSAHSSKKKRRAHSFTTRIKASHRKRTLHKSVSDSHKFVNSKSCQDILSATVLADIKPSCDINRFQRTVNEQDRMGFTVLHKASQSGDIQALCDAINLGGDVNKVTSQCQGHTPPLLYAASEGHVTIVNKLLLSGADPNARDAWGNTPLFKAACYNQVECVKSLLQYGADVNIGNKWGALPLQFASLQGYDSVIELLLEYSHTNCTGDISLPPPIIGAATRCHLKSMTLLLASLKPDVHELQSSLTMALYYFLCTCAGFEYTTTAATIDDRLQCLQHLVNYGAPITPDHIKMCCYHHFIPLLNLESYVDMLQLLLQSLSYDAQITCWQNAMTVVFGHVTRLGPHKWNLIQLITSTGFTPSKYLLEQVKFSFSDNEYNGLIMLQSNPRSLVDCARISTRKTLSTNNVNYGMKSIEIPSLLKNIVLLKSRHFMSLNR